MRFKIEDMTTNTESATTDILEAVWSMDFLRGLGHDVRIIDTETGRHFFWRGQ